MSESIIQQSNRPVYPVGTPLSNLQGEKPRKLSKEEIDDITSSLPNVSSAVDEISAKSRQAIIDRLKYQLSKIQVTPNGLSNLKEIIIISYERSRIPGGSVVGLSAAESLGAPVTQMALNSFHQSGTAKNVTTGIEGINELINATPIRRAPSSTIIFKDPNITFNDILVDKRADMVDVTVDKLLVGESYLIDTPENILGVNPANLTIDEPYWYSQFRLIVNDIPTSRWIARLFLDVNMLYTFKVTPEDVANSIMNNNQNIVFCVYSPILVGEGLSASTTTTNNAIAYIDVYPNEITVRSGLPEDTKSSVTQENQSLIFLETVLIMSLNKIHIKGIPRINMIFPVEVTVWQIVSIETLLNDGNFRLDLSKTRMKTTGISKEKLLTLLKVIDIEVLSSDSTSIIVKVPNKSQYPDIDVILNQDPETESNPIEKEKKRKKLKSYITPNELFRYKQALDELDSRQYEKRQRDEVNRLITVEKNVQAALRIATQRPQTPFSKAANFAYADSDGINLKALFNRNDVDPYHTYSNNVYEILFLLGIDAARTFLIKELSFVIAAGGEYINPRHIILLVDFMTFSGSIRKVMLSGVKAQPTGVLSHVSFEQAMKGFADASAFGIKEGISSTSAAVFTGNRIRGGTGHVNIVVDEKRRDELLAEAKKIIPKQIDVASISNAISGTEASSFSGALPGIVPGTTMNSDLENQFLSLVGTIKPAQLTVGTIDPVVLPIRNPTLAPITILPSLQQLPLSSTQTQTPILIRPAQVIPEKLQQVANEVKELPCLPTTNRNVININPQLSSIQTIPVNVLSVDGVPSEAGRLRQQTPLVQILPTLQPTLQATGVALPVRIPIVLPPVTLATPVVPSSTPTNIKISNIPSSSVSAISVPKTTRNDNIEGLIKSNTVKQ